MTPLKPATGGGGVAGLLIQCQRRALVPNVFGIPCAMELAARAAKETGSLRPERGSGCDERKTLRAAAGRRASRRDGGGGCARGSGLSRAGSIVGGARARAGKSTSG